MGRRRGLRNRYNRQEGNATAQSQNQPQEKTGQREGGENTRGS
jgi:hypothetical protein